MSTSALAPAKDTVREREITLDLIDRLLGAVTPRDFGFVLWDGTEWGNVDGACTILLRHPGSLRAMFVPPNDLTAGEAYLRGDFEVEGSMERAVDLGYTVGRQHRGLPELLSLAAELLRLPASEHGPGLHGAAKLDGDEHSLERDRAAIRHHYDVGNDFYALWLDEEMTYSCAYFHDHDQDLDSAQRAKYEHICRKLRLAPGDRVLDIGCGWGGLLRYAAHRYGIEGVGITLSEEQAELARERTRTEDLDTRVSFEVVDYREAGAFGRFDKLVSVGMFEHVGAKMLPDYFAQALELLREGGLFLNHGIAADKLGTRVKRRSFMQRYVFPDGQLETISEVLVAAEQAGFEVRDVESLREHYAITLRHWIERLEENARAVADLTSDTTYRIWRIYMSGCAAGFRRGTLSVFQTLLAKPSGDVSGLPLTRAHLYLPNVS